MMVAEYQLQLPDKAVLQKKLQELVNYTIDWRIKYGTLMWVQIEYNYYVSQNIAWEYGEYDD